MSGLFDFRYLCKSEPKFTWHTQVRPILRTDDSTCDSTPPFDWTQQGNSWPVWSSKVAQLQRLSDPINLLRHHTNVFQLGIHLSE